MTIDLAGLTPVADGFAFTECPRWRDGWLYFSDMYGRAVYRLDEGGAVEEVVREDARPGGLGFLADGSLLVAAMDAGRVMRLKDGAYGLHCDLSALAPGGVNDMVVSSEGRCYVAHFSHDMPPPSKPLLFVDERGEGSEADDLLKVANGMVLTADGKSLIVAESAGGRISRLDLGEGGRPINRMTFAELPPGHYADGICGDAAGGIWVTCMKGPGVIRVEEGGAITHRVPIDGGRSAARTGARSMCAPPEPTSRIAWLRSATPVSRRSGRRSRAAAFRRARAPAQLSTNPSYPACATASHLSR